jgi:Zn finger protein HypA/HybF involved in hydrogenase expression
MANDADDDNAASTAAVVPFPFSRVSPAQSASTQGEIVFGEMAAVLGIPQEQTTGHWCSRCNKIWYGYLLEVTCPTCGNRHG